MHVIRYHCYCFRKAYLGSNIVLDLHLFFCNEPTNFIQRWVANGVQLILNVLSYLKLECVKIFKLKYIVPIRG